MCKSCRPHSPLKHVWVRTIYGNTAEKLVWMIKFERAGIAVAEVIGDMLADTLPYFSDEVIVISVPAATSRIRQRGYDQAELIARRAARNKKLAYIPALARTTQKRQVGSSRQRRLTQLAGSFRMQKDGIVKGKVVVIVDDVLTTGATLEECARVVRKAGAKRVYGAVFAR